MMHINSGKGIAIVNRWIDVQKPGITNASRIDRKIDDTVQKFERFYESGVLILVYLRKKQEVYTYYYETLFRPLAGWS